MVLNVVYNSFMVFACFLIYIYIYITTWRCYWDVVGVIWDFRLNSLNTGARHHKCQGSKVLVRMENLIGIS